MAESWAPEGMVGTVGCGFLKRGRLVVGEEEVRGSIGVCAQTQVRMFTVGRFHVPQAGKVGAFEASEERS